MRRRLTAFFTIFIMLVSCINVQPCMANAEAVKAGTVNTALEASDIVEISTLAELEAFRDDVNSGNTYSGITVKLTADIDMSGKYGADIGGKEVSWTPIGISYEKSFRGFFDGGEHEIAGLYICTSEDNQGLFGFTYGAEIKNISVSGNVFGGWMVGGIAGYNQEGLMKNCHNSVTVTGGWNLRDAYYIGGVTGRNDGTLENCSNEGDIIGSNAIGTGGMAGVNYTTVMNCSNTGSVTGSQSTGGIIGENEGDMENCHNTGDVYGYYYVGGIVGNNSCKVEFCSNKGCISGTEEVNSVGGIAGSNFGTVGACYNTEVVSGFCNVGGIVGSNWDFLADCYNKGEVTGSGSNIGGVTGTNIDSVITCYNIGDVTGKVYRVGGISGLNDKEGVIAGCYSMGNISGEDGVGGVIGVNYEGGYIETCHYLEGTAAGGVNGQDTENAKQNALADFAKESTFYNWDFRSEWEMSSALGRPILRANREILAKAEPGDVNRDGEINSSDALDILRYDVGLTVLEPEVMKLADVDGKEGVDSGDALCILKYDVGIITDF